MGFSTFLSEAFILEGGAAIKSSQPLTQAEARSIQVDVIHLLKQHLSLSNKDIAAVGSAGMLPAGIMSGDIDIAVVAHVDAVKDAVKALAHNGDFKQMSGINVYSFAYEHHGKIAQVDVIPVPSIRYAKWVFHSDPGDIANGLRGSHRNEVLFAVAKHAEMKPLLVKDGVLVRRERLSFDLSRGLARIQQDRQGKTKVKRSFDTVSKTYITSDPDEIIMELFGEHFTASSAMSWPQMMKMLQSPLFKHRSKLPEIIERLVDGLTSKKLTVPAELTAMRKLT